MLSATFSPAPSCRCFRPATRSRTACCARPWWWWPRPSRRPPTCLPPPMTTLRARATATAPPNGTAAGGRPRSLARADAAQGQIEAALKLGQRPTNVELGGIAERDGNDGCGLIVLVPIPVRAHLGAGTVAVNEAGLGAGGAARQPIPQGQQ